MKRVLKFKALHPGYHLIEWLNGASFDPACGRVTPHRSDSFTGEALPSKASHNRITKLIELVKQLDALSEELEERKPDWREQLNLHFLLAREFDKAAEDYPGVPSWEDNPDGYVGVYSENRGWRRDGEFMAAHCVILLGRTGAIERLRQCICGTWFLARRRDQKSCSHRCRHKRYERTEGFKKDRAIYMRWRYAVMGSKAWVGISEAKRPTWDQWRNYKEPTPEKWLQILKRSSNSEYQAKTFRESSSSQANRE